MLDPSFDDEHGMEFVLEKSPDTIPISVEDFRSACEQAVSRGVPIIFRNMIPDSLQPTWDKHFEHLNMQWHNPDGYGNGVRPHTANPMRERLINNVTLSGFFFTVTAVTDSKFFSSLAPFQNFLEDALGGAGTDVPVPNMQFISLVSEDVFSDPHRDPQHTIYLQSQGAVRWRFYDKPEDCHQCAEWNFDGVIRKGDIVFIPQEVVHSVELVEPRAALAYRADNPDWGNLPVVEKKTYSWEDHEYS